jgi:cell division protein FtsB
LEFSYDRSKDSHLHTPEERTNSQTHPQRPLPQATQQTFNGIRPGPDLNTVDPSTIANERLRKAIERNRAKQGIRSPQPTAETRQAAPQTHEEEVTSAAASESARPRMRARERVSTPPESTTVVSRRSVAKPEDTEFVPVKRTQRKVASQISYTTTGTTKRKQKSLDPKYQGWLIKGSWIFCAVMVLRLIFAAGGVTDFYSQKNSVSARLGELSDIKKENMQLVREIERMRSDTGFQKKLVRASDEFLVLFPK